MKIRQSPTRQADSPTLRLTTSVRWFSDSCVREKRDRLAEQRAGLSVNKSAVAERPSASVGQK